MPTLYESLIKLADEAGYPESEFSAAERKLFGSLANGVAVDCEEEPEGREREIRAGLFEWVMTDREAAKLHHHRGVDLTAAFFPDGFDISYATIKAPLCLRKCDFRKGLDLEQTTLPLLLLSQSTIEKGSRDGALSADRATIGGSVFLDRAFSAKGEVRFLGASIGGDLSMAGAVLDSQDSDALSADGATIGGAVFLDEAFSAKGKVRLLGASIGGSLSMSGATLDNQDGGALSADGATIGGNACLDEAFSAKGEVRFLGASIGGNLSMAGATLDNQDDNALSADNATISGSVFLSDKFSASGTVRLNGASIGSSLSFNGSNLTSQGRSALNAQNLHLERVLFLNGARIDGVVDLVASEIGKLCDDKEVWGLDDFADSSHAIPLLDGCVYRSIGVASPIDADFRKRWIALGQTPNFGFKPQPYTQLSKVLREMGHPQEAKRILIAREKRQLRESGLPVFTRRWRWLFSEQLLGHGYEPSRALWPLLVFLLLGWFLFRVAWDEQAFVPTSARVYTLYKEDGETRRFDSPYDELTDSDLTEYPAFNSFIYTVDTLLPIVDLHQEDHWIPIGWWRVYLWTHIAAGWVFTTLLVAGFAGVVRKPME